MSDDEERNVLGLKIELEILIPKTIDEASREGGQLGRFLFNKVFVALRNLLQENGASGEDASNAILNAQIVSFAYTLATAIAAMEGSSMLPEDIEKKITPILRDVMHFTGELIGQHAKKGLFSIRDRTGIKNDLKGDGHE
jgi:hypothetical protein